MAEKPSARACFRKLGGLGSNMKTLLLVTINGILFY
jgi:hypothetical protein